MRIGFFLSNYGGSPLVAGLERGLKQLGHLVENYYPMAGYDLVLVFNQCAHVTNYVYPEFPKPGIPIAFIDSAEYGYFKRLPGVVHNYATAFSEGSLNHDTKNLTEQRRLQAALEGRSFPYFLREFIKDISFPVGYYPIDYPLYHYSVCSHAPNRDEYMARQLDLFVSWGASHPWRLKITEALRHCHTKCEIKVLEENGTPRMPQVQFFEKTRSSKCSVSFDGYGSGSFRMTEVLVRCLLLQGPLSIHRHEPLINGLHCVEYDISHSGEDFIETNVCKVLRNALADQERSYRIYEAGFNHCMTHYTEKATAQYVMDVVHKHDWKKPTQLTI